jgi:ubiquinone/menaquinone biosynthesis C-methylase UbiE
MDTIVKQQIQTAYDAAAKAYTEKCFHELDGKPLDRKLLDLFAERVIPPGKACEIGCGPGEIANYLKAYGMDIVGIDLCPKMIAEARRLSPDIVFEQGDAFTLQFEKNSLAGIVAFYLIVNFRQEDIPDAFQEMERVLRPGGVLLLSFHVGQETIHLDEFLGNPVQIDFMFFQPDDIVRMLKDRGFIIDEIITRSPYKTVEYPSQRAYIFAHKPNNLQEEEE